MTSTQREREKAIETVLTGQKRALELAVSGGPLSEVLDLIARTVEQQSTSDVLASILLLDESGRRLRHAAAPSLPAAYNAAIDGIEIGPNVGSCGTAAATGRIVVVRDIMTNPLWAEFKDLARQHGLRACWSMPIRSTTGRILGTFALYHRIATEPSDRDREIVELLAQTAALIIDRDHHSRERAMAQAELAAMKEAQARRINTMFQHAPAGIALLRGPDHVFEIVNPKYLELIGGRDVVGKSLRAAFPELDGQGFHELLDGVYRTGEAYVGRAQRVLLVRSPGSPPEECFFDFVYEALPGSDGRPEAIIVVAFEVTELVRARRTAEEAKRAAEASEHSLKQFIENLPELAWTAQADGHIDYYNRRWYEYTGTTFAEMQGWGWEKVHDPDLLPLVKERWQHSIATGTPFEMEFTLRGADGVRRWFLTRVQPLRDEAGKVVRWFGTNANIEVLKASQALTLEVARQSEEAQRMIVEMRDALERAERKAAALEAERASRRTTA